MKKFYIVIGLFSLLLPNLWGQTLEQAKEMFAKKEYEKASLAFKRLVTSQPTNATYNYWYGACALKNANAALAIKPLELAVQRRILDAPIYLGQAYNELYRFEEAVKCYEAYLETLSKKKQPVAEVEKLLEKSKANLRLLKGVEEVCIVDSFVVSKANFLSTYKLSPESGKLVTYNEFFGTQGAAPGTVYQTELENKIYYSEAEDKENTQKILSKYKMLGEWSPGVLLPHSVNAGANANYPFVLSDGVTIYYAWDGAASMGGYDIFVTRYNSNTNTYLTPENVGMPFNSPANDYMFVIDEYSNLGWFASDRYQPEGKVCIYVFIPNSTKQTYSYELIEPKQMIGLAQIHALKDTWKEKKEVEAALQRLKVLNREQPQTKLVSEFQFTVTDQTTYFQLSDFKSAQAKELALQHQQKEKELQQQESKLATARQAYAAANKEQREKMAAAIIDLENNIQQLSLNLDTLAIRARNAEITKQ